jgi:hypothetical protein
MFAYQQPDVSGHWRTAAVQVRNADPRDQRTNHQFDPEFCAEFE